MKKLSLLVIALSFVAVNNYASADTTATAGATTAPHHHYCKGRCTSKGVLNETCHTDCLACASTVDDNGTKTLSKSQFKKLVNKCLSSKKQ